MERELTPEELFFFQRKRSSLPLYVEFRQRLYSELPDTVLKVQKTQIGLYLRHLFGAVSFLLVRKADIRPACFLTLSIGTGRPIPSPRIDAAAEPYPGRWTNHVMLTVPEDVDEELMGWIREAAAFSAGKR